jgi:hypothetical protein
MTRSPPRGPQADADADAPAAPEEEPAPGWPLVERREHPRRRVHLPATFLREDGTPIATEVVDISAGGIRLAGAGGLRPGARGAVSVEGLFGPLSCTVMGTEAGMLRLRFDSLEALRARLVERLAALSWDPQRH